jgi:hypothetical protein
VSESMCKEFEKLDENEEVDERAHGTSICCNVTSYNITSKRIT